MLQTNMNPDVRVTSSMEKRSDTTVQTGYEMNLTTVVTTTTSTAIVSSTTTSSPKLITATQPEDDTTTDPLPEEMTFLSTNFKTKIPVEIRFEGIKYVVRDRFKSQKKTVLHEISGQFPPNKLIAIMGPSGAGKSTLLDLISGYRTGVVEGSVFVNGQPRDLDDFRRMSCYIQQDDRIQPLLTVEENMSLAADLKLGPHVPQKQKDAMVNEILSVLGLRGTRNTRGARLSGGQQKRLSIALELISNPSVMFLDEPTTGLDSSSCTQCISLLRQLAHQGRTIICTIHQPSATLFAQFDQVYILAEGRCLYQGTTANMLRFLNRQKIPCPMYHNPADFIIEIASGEYGKEKIEALCDGIKNGRNIDWFKSSKIFQEIELPRNMNEKTSPKNKKSHINNQMTPAYYQLKTLLKRGFIKLKRDQTLTYMRIIVNFLVSLMLGSLYVNSGEDANKVFDNYNLLFSVIMHHVMSSMMLNIISFPMEIGILLKEHFNRWYSLKMYYFANVILDMPVTTFSCVLFSSIVYFMTNQLFEWNRFAVYTLTSILLVFISQSLGYIFGTVLDVVNGTFAGPIFLVPMMMFSGFGVNLRDIPKYLEWGTHVSFFRYALEGYVEAVYGFNRRVFSCYTEYCHYRYPSKFLNEVAMEHINVTFAIEMLLLTLLLTRVMGYLVLWWKVRFGR